MTYRLLRFQPLRAVVVLALALGCAAAAQEVQRPTLDRVDAVIEVRQAQRLGPDGVEQVESLPDILRAADGAADVEARYRFDFDATAGRSGWALYLSGAIGHARIALNGHVLLDTITTPLASLPLSINLLRLVDLPPHLVRESGNRVEIMLRSRKLVSLSRILLGAQHPLREARQVKALGMVYGPAVVAALMACLGASVLLIWLRRHGEPIYGYFGIASLAWGLHTAWSVSPREVIGGIHGSVAWTVLYAFVVAMLSIFCLRFTGHNLPRVERGVRWALAGVVPLLYLSIALGIHDAVDAAVRLAMVVGTLTVLGAVARRAWTARSTDTTLLVLAGFVAAAFGFRDWLVSETSNDYLPVLFTPYAGLPFVVLMAWLLIDRFVRNTEALEGLNRELEQRVRDKSAELVTALDHMRAARDWAESANRSKSSFLAAASHDLRQPIHALGLYMTALRGRRLDAAAGEIVQRMDGSVAALESLFNALLDISRMDAGAVVPQPRAVDLAATLRRLLDEMAGEAAERGLRLSLRVGARPAPAVASADPVLLERVLRNLIGNALKYTRAGGVLVTCRARAGPPPRWRVEVWDSGPGIAEAERERVFDEFYQAGNPERDRRAGLGLGLSIVRRLARLMQWPLALHSRVGHGTRVSLDLPMTDEPVLESAASVEPGSLAGRVIALIEDDIEVRDAMVRLLRGWGCEALAGADADELMLQADMRSLAPAAVVADLRLRGGHDGLKAIDALRARWGAGLPALLVSGDSAPERVRLMQGSGIPWLSKPVPAARLRSWLMAVTRSPASSSAEPVS
jgi:signal transduction histidine kinase/CheY-like chemotaxis protein